MTLNQNQMEEDVLPVLPAYKLYKDRSVYIGTFLGGPLVAGYLAAENFNHLGDPGKAKPTWIIAIMATILIFAAIFLIPDIEKIPRLIIPILYSALAQYLVGKYQGAAIKSHIERGGQTYSVWRVVWIGLVGLVVLTGIIFLVVLLTNKELLQ